MKTLYLVRHAHSAYTPDEYGRGLTVKGKKDAERVTQTFLHYPIDMVLSSPYQRAIDTVAGIAHHKNLTIELVPDLCERCLAEKPVSDFETAIKTLWDNPSFSHPGGESNQTATKRGIKAINQILQQYHEHQHIVIGTHGNLMALIMQYYDSQYDYLFWKNELKMPDIYGLTFDELNCVEIFHIPLLTRIDEK